MPIISEFVIEFLKTINIRNVKMCTVGKLWVPKWAGPDRAAGLSRFS